MTTWRRGISEVFTRAAEEISKLSLRNGRSRSLLASYDTTYPCRNAPTASRRGVYILLIIRTPVRPTLFSPSRRDRSRAIRVCKAVSRQRFRPRDRPPNYEIRPNCPPCRPISHEAWWWGPECACEYRYVSLRVCPTRDPSFSTVLSRVVARVYRRP